MNKEMGHVHLKELLLFIFTLYNVLTISYGKQEVRYDYGTNKQLIKKVYSNLIVHINAIKEHCKSLVIDANYMRFMYEETAEYEQGYVFGEIIEKFRQMVGMVERCVSTDIYIFWIYLKYTEVTQKLFFELFELVAMFHEIPYKYWEEPLTAPEYTSKEQDKMKFMKAQEGYTFMNFEKEYKQFLKDRKKEQKKKQKMTQKLKKSMHKIKNPDLETHRRPNKSRFWPIEYGWEIQYYW